MRKDASAYSVVLLSVFIGLLAGVKPTWAGQLEDLLLENKQITIDQWVQLKAEEEKRQAKALEESRGVGDVPVSERWYEKISIRGFAQLRYNDSSNPFLISDQGDRSIGRNDEFFFRRIRLIISGQPHERIFVYFQEEFATVTGTNTQIGSNPITGTNTATGPNNVPQLRDLFADLFLTENKEWRIRAGQTKIPFGFETMQSSQNRLAFDRSDAINSAAVNERGIGVFLYYAPTSVRERFRRLVDSGLKGSGDYGMLGIGVYNGQADNETELNRGKHFIFHSMYPHEFANGQILEVGMDAYTGQYVVSTTPVVPVPPDPTNFGAPISPIVTNNGNYLDQRATWHVVLYPQPFGLQGEYTIGRGPELNQQRTEVVTGNVRGGYLQVFYNYKCDTWCQSVFPFIRFQEYYGGKKFEANAPRHTVREWEFGLEYQFNRALELTFTYALTQRTSADPTTNPASCSNPALGTGFQVPCVQTPYQLQTGNLLRFQLQWSF
jgi:hypothetical protein